MESLEKQALQVAKEIVVKFIEVGRVSPANFAEHFAEIYCEILNTVGGGTACVPAKAHKKKDKAE